jgi:hypothetical protein
MRSSGVAVQFPEPTDPDERRRWLEKLAAACERVLSKDPEPVTDPHYAFIQSDVVELLARIRAELDAMHR